ncbi:type IV secretion system protein [Sphingomonas sp. 3-13AW]|uniref:type IV secretion system protein n=1 Tax=Sphingomonas sp. 3-13AW TaxID=3050450 RepID=UPI003BB5E460
MEAPDDGVRDDLGEYPENVSDQPSYVRAIERTLRSVTLVAVISGLMNVALIMLMITIFPLQKVVPYMVTFKGQESQVVRIEAFEADAQSMRFATEDSVRQYVSLRHKVTPDFAVMNQQWGPKSRIAAQTALPAYQAFRKAADDELKQLVSQNYSREVQINTVNLLPGGTWQVSFTTVDHSSGQVLPAPSTGGFGVNASAAQSGIVQAGESRQEWVATMRVAFQPQRVQFNDRLLNPLGFTVTDYSVTRRS